MRKILVVDDSSTIRKAIRKILESLNFCVEEAEDGEAALDYCRSVGLPDVMLLDIDMPKMDGMQCLKQIRADAGLNDLVVVMCTSHNTLSKIEEAIGLGANEYIMKPFTNDIILDKLRQVGVSQ